MLYVRDLGSVLLKMLRPSSRFQELGRAVHKAVAERHQRAIRPIERFLFDRNVEEIRERVELFPRSIFSSDPIPFLLTHDLDVLKVC